ncbi:nicotinamidase-related amidase [Microbacterium terrae]|uniref:Isochorismatase family protein YecD n=1 Tax=Microbacterium terrae TaxID=69369 RepID=A0A0M2H6A8_9MICO|nr:cysteine hydrolase family protein [Microbacterium terrae]KJL42027.1 Isochorismatase family protein YecD [Microbacterium terrae]MBP1076710.1 nicotinamidase-related amidase [Microbacterium terrae]GLJ97538.1 isochorismatase [Microbacterium terrae]
MTRALVVIDMQRAFDDLSFWGQTTNPQCEANVAALADAWASRGEPVVVVRHDSVSPGSPLAPGSPGNELVAVVAGREPALRVVKSVNSAFYGDPDLHGWLQEQGIGELVICGIQTNMCVETTARMAGNLGYDVTVALDATRTFDLTTDVAGVGPVTRSAAELMLTTALELQAGGFARIATTASLVG